MIACQTAIQGSNRAALLIMYDFRSIVGGTTRLMKVQ